VRRSLLGVGSCIAVSAAAVTAGLVSNPSLLVFPFSRGESGRVRSTSEGDVSMRFDLRSEKDEIDKLLTATLKTECTFFYSRETDVRLRLL
jgi:hypothetical protein